MIYKSCCYKGLQIRYNAGVKILDLSFKTPEENLACDEALLELSENGGNEEILRFWESPSYFAVLGYSNKMGSEIKLPACEADAIPVLRRPSGGGTVLQGPGCLNYALVLKIPSSGPLKNLKSANEHIMETHRLALETVLKRTVKVEGITDLACDGLKFSGNAQRRKKSFFLFHGTFLYNFKISMIEKYLGFPSSQPNYRASRKHEDFVANIPLSPEKIKKALAAAWKTGGEATSPPASILQELISEKYSQVAWNRKF